MSQGMARIMNQSPQRDFCGLRALWKWLVSSQTCLTLVMHYSNPPVLCGLSTWRLDRAGAAGGVKMFHHTSKISIFGLQVHRKSQLWGNLCVAVMLCNKLKHASYGVIHSWSLCALPICHIILHSPSEVQRQVIVCKWGLSLISEASTLIRSNGNADRLLTEASLPQKS